MLNRLAREAQRQIDLLVGHSQGKSNSQFEFYPYRYFAAEGFLPGFNFPRLPVRAFIPAGEGGEFISRPAQWHYGNLLPITFFTTKVVNSWWPKQKFLLVALKASING